MTPNSVRTDNGVAANTKVDLESWGGGTEFRRLPSNDSVLAKSKHTRRGHEEGL